MIKLSTWAEEEYGNPIPGSATLSKYARNGMIFPPPEKLGISGALNALRDS